MLDRQWTCSHTDQERLICGTWCTSEISKAVQKGYRIVKIHEIWHFPEDQHVEGLFTRYVDTWLKMKQNQAGGHLMYAPQKTCRITLTTMKCMKVSQWNQEKL